jgi:hypothetical protein
LNSIIELKERINAQDNQVKQLISLQIENERRHAKEKEEALGTLGLLGVIVAAMLAGAGLITLHHILSTRRAAQPVAEADTMPDWDAMQDDMTSTATSDDDANEPSERSSMPSESWGAQAWRDGGVTAVAGPPPEVLPSRIGPAPSIATRTEVKVEPPAVTSDEEAKQDMELDGLLDLFGEQKAVVTATIQRLRATRSRDPEEWLGLVRQARVAGLMNSEDMQIIIGEFKRLFNASLTHEPSDVGLENFPHVTRQVQQTWGRHEGLTVLNSLLFDDREGGRSGFPELCFEELVTLRDVLAVRVAMFGEDPAQADVAAEPEPNRPTRAELKAGEAHLIEFELPVPPAGKA